MVGRIITTSLVMVTLLLVIIGNISATANDVASLDGHKTSAVMSGSSKLDI